MVRPKLVTSLAELHESTVLFDRLVRENYDSLSANLQKVVQNAFSHTRSFIVFPREDGQGYHIGFSKIVGHQIKDIATYDAWRKRISGSDSERAINALGIARDYGLGSATEARAAPPEIAQAVKDFVGLADKTPNTLSWIRLMPLPEEAQGDNFVQSRTYEVLLAAMKAAQLSKVERERLFVEAII